MTQSHMHLNSTFMWIIMSERLFDCKNYEDIFPLCCRNLKYLNNLKTQLKSYQNYKVWSFFLSDHSPLVDWQCMSDMHYIHLIIETEDQSITFVRLVFKYLSYQVPSVMKNISQAFECALFIGLRMLFIYIFI